MLKKVKDRRKALILSKTKEIENDICMILSSHGYSPDITTEYDTIIEKMIYHQPPLFIADIALLPEFPAQLISIFSKARKTPTFLIIDDLKSKEKLNRYMEYSDDILRIPLGDDNLYYKIKKAVNHNEVIQDNQYYQGIFLMLKLMSPLLLLLVFIITVEI
jgi:DNA-binding response OmpR family regulator